MMWHTVVLLKRSLFYLDTTRYSTCSLLCKEMLATSIFCDFIWKWTCCIYEKPVFARRSLIEVRRHLHWWLMPEHKNVCLKTCSVSIFICEKNVLVYFIHFLPRKKNLWNDRAPSLEYGIQWRICRIIFIIIFAHSVDTSWFDAI